MLAWCERVRSGERLKDLFLFHTRLFDTTVPSPLFSLRYFEGTMRCAGERAILEGAKRWRIRNHRLSNRSLPFHSPLEAVELVNRDSPSQGCSTRRAALPWSIPSGDKTPRPPSVFCSRPRRGACPTLGV